MTLWSVVVGLGFSLIGAVCVLLVIVGLPGAWIMLAVAALIDLLLAPRVGDGAAFFGWWAIGAGAVVALLGEVIETLAAAEGARRGGASVRGAIGATIGGIVGAIAGTILIPILVVGSLVGAALVAVAGAVLGELTREGMRSRATAKPATGAAIGKGLGGCAKAGDTIVALRDRKSTRLNSSH